MDNETISPPQTPRVAGGLDMFIRRLGALHPDRVAVEEPERMTTFGELSRATEQCAAGLHALGVRKGDRVAIHMENRVEWLIAYFAIGRIRAVSVPINILADHNEVADILSETEAVTIVTSATLLGRDRPPATPIAPIVIAGGDGPTADTNPWPDLFGAGRHDGEASRPDDLSSLYYSSATTGRSKAAMHTHLHEFTSAMQQIIDVGLTPDTRHLVTGSLSWAGSLHGLTLPTLLAAGTVVLIPTGNMTAGRVSMAIETHQPTTVILVPTLLRRIVDDEDAIRRLARSALRLIVTGAEPVPLWLLDATIDALPDVDLIQSYGTSEFPVMAAVLGQSDARTHAGSTGRASFLTELGILRDGEIHSSGQGEVVYRSPCTTAGYWKRPDETETAFIDDWFRTGDLGSLDDDGFLTINGRAKDLIIRGGLNVYPAEVEVRLQPFTEGRSLAVVGVPDPEFGELIVAIVEGFEPFDRDAFLESARSVLPRYKCPSCVLLFPDEFPKGPSGKLLKRELRDWAHQISTTTPTSH